jgi:hypothetical protein
VDSILTEAAIEIHLALFIVAAKHAGELSLEGNDSAVEDAVRGGDQVAWNDGVGIVAPDDFGTAGGSFLPGNIGKGVLGHFDKSFMKMVDFEILERIGMPACPTLSPRSTLGPQRKLLKNSL